VITVSCGGRAGRDDVLSRKGKPPGEDDARADPAFAYYRWMVQRRLEVMADDHHPAYVVWEITLRCDQPCRHCGSRAGAARPEELTTEEALLVVAQLAKMRAREVVLIGGEAYLHEGFFDIIRALRRAGVRPTMTTGGAGVTEELAAQMKSAGLHSVSVSVDGLAATHDRVRKVNGSFDRAVSALDHLRNAGLLIAANTNVNRVNEADLEALFELLATKGIRSWQIQITSALVRILPRIAQLKQQAFARGITIMPGNNLGYFGPEESLLRSVKRDGADHWQGCQAGKFVLGIESDGAVKGCPSLQTSHYVGGNLRKQSLRQIWNESDELAFARGRTRESLWGYCQSCVYADTCLGGCSFTAHALFGRAGNNPYCHFRAGDFARRGLRERLVAKAAAPGQPFDHGEFEIEIEAFDAAEPFAQADADALVKLSRKPNGTFKGLSGEQARREREMAVPRIASDDPEA
jgi:radical SAM protein with 4Fe4S-binding SPASM domain